MIKAALVVDEITLALEGEIEIGDVYPDKCCEGFGWEVCIIDDNADEPYFTNVGGVCGNTKAHPYGFDTAEGFYAGYSTIYAGDLVDMVLQYRPSLESHIMQIIESA